MNLQTRSAFKHKKTSLWVVPTNQEKCVLLLQRLMMLSKVHLKADKQMQIKIRDKALCNVFFFLLLFCKQFQLMAALCDFLPDGKR